MTGRRAHAFTRGLTAAGWLTLALAPAAAVAGPAPRVHTVVVDDMRYGPVPAGIRVGDTVRWVNRDIFRHTATARDRSFDLDLPPKATAEAVVKRSGVIRVECRFHPGMKTELNVAK